MKLYCIYLIALLQIGYTQHIPVMGQPVNEFERIDSLIITLMKRFQINSSAISITKDNYFYLNRSYGWLDTLKTNTTPTDALYRIASNTKPIIATATRILMERGFLTLQDKAFDINGNGGILKLNPFGNNIDLRIENITIDHLINHTGGWDRGITGDPAFQFVSIANVMNNPPPASIQDVINYVIGTYSLNYDPGNIRSYSNFGYMVLGEIIEQESGMDLLDFIHENIFRPICVPDSEIQYSRTLIEHQNPREPYYQSKWTRSNVFNPEETIPAPYGGFYAEGHKGNGGLIASTWAYNRFMNHFWLSGFPREEGNQHWWHTGSLDGTNTLANQRWDGINIVVHFNQRREDGIDSAFADYMKVQLDQFFDTLSTLTEPLNIYTNKSCDYNDSLYLSSSQYSSSYSSSGVSSSSYGISSNLNSSSLMLSSSFSNSSSAISSSLYFSSSNERQNSSDDFFSSSSDISLSSLSSYNNITPITSTQNNAEIIRAVFSNEFSLPFIIDQHISIYALNGLLLYKGPAHQFKYQGFGSRVLILKYRVGAKEE